MTLLNAFNATTSSWAAASLPIGRKTKIIISELEALAPGRNSGRLGFRRGDESQRLEEEFRHGRNCSEGEQLDRQSRRAGLRSHQRPGRCVAVLGQHVGVDGAAAAGGF